MLQAGARFVGVFWLPSKAPGPAITIRSGASLPERRLTPADAHLLPTIASGNADPALDATGASNWKLDGIRFESTTTGEGEIIVLQDATNITLDRLLIVAGDNGQKRAIRGNGRHIVLSRSHIANIWREGQDSQTFCAWDGAGPYTIVDNYLEAASENIMFGGANSASPERVPADILVERNHLTKRREWQGANKGVKNLFELKQARRAVIRNNLMERVWPEAQTGYAILVTVRNDDGGAPWAVVQDVLFEGNVIREAYAGVNMLGYDIGNPSGQTTRVTFRDNVFFLSGPFLLIGGEVGVVTFDHNTVRQGGPFAILYKGEVWPSGEGPRAARVAAESLTITNTLAHHNDLGVLGDDVGTGAVALVTLTSAFVWTHNVLAGEGGWGYVYPPGTAVPSMAEYLSHFNSDGSLSSTSTYRRAATDGSDLGARNPPPSEGAINEPPQVGNAPPIVKVTSPTAGATFTAPATITLAADAVDPDGEIARVEFFANGQHVATELAAPYLLNWPSVPAGTYTLTAVAYDGSGASTTSAPVTFSVSTGSGGGNAPPIVTVTSPTAGATFTAPATITLAADATDPDGEIARVEFFANNQHVATERVAPYLLDWPSVPAGTYTLTAVAYDGSGASTTSAPVTFSVSTGSGGGNARPIVTVTSPTAGATFTAPATITLSANAVDPDGEIARVEFFANSQHVATERVAPYLLNWPSVPAGTYTLTAVAYDGSGAGTTSAPVTFSVSTDSVGGNARPIVTVTSPTAGATFTAPATITLAADATDPDGAIARVEFFANSQHIATERVAPYLLNWPSVPAGTYTLTAVAYDGSGASTTSAPVTFNVSNDELDAPREVVFTASSDHATVTNYVLKVYPASVDSRTGTPIATSDLGKPAPDANDDVTVDRFAFFGSLAPGNYSATVTAISAGGQTPSAAVAFAR